MEKHIIGSSKKSSVLFYSLSYEYTNEKLAKFFQEHKNTHRESSYMIAKPFAVNDFHRDTGDSVIKRLCVQCSSQ